GVLGAQECPQRDDQRGDRGGDEDLPPHPWSSRCGGFVARSASFGRGRHPVSPSVTGCSVLTRCMWIRPHAWGLAMDVARRGVLEVFSTVTTEEVPRESCDLHQGASAGIAPTLLRIDRSVPSHLLLKTRYAGAVGNRAGAPVGWACVHAARRYRL